MVFRENINYFDTSMDFILEIEATGKYSYKLLKYFVFLLI